MTVVVKFFAKNLMTFDTLNVIIGSMLEFQVLLDGKLASRRVSAGFTGELRISVACQDHGF